GFCTFLRPDSLLSVVWAQVCEVEGLAVFRYKPLNWKGRIVKPESAPVLQFPLCGLPKLRFGVRSAPGAFESAVAFSAVYFWGGTVVSFGVSSWWSGTFS
ncbi:hypothetical protein Vretifemale_20585, partial [Volvox reticuliferus]